MSSLEDLEDLEQSREKDRDDSSKKDKDDTSNAADQDGDAEMRKRRRMTLTQKF